LTCSRRLSLRLSPKPIAREVTRYILIFTDSTNSQIPPSPSISSSRNSEVSQVGAGVSCSVLWYISSTASGALHSRSSIELPVTSTPENRGSWHERPRQRCVGHEDIAWFRPARTERRPMIAAQAAQQVLRARVQTLTRSLLIHLIRRAMREYATTF